MNSIKSIIYKMNKWKLVFGASIAVLLVLLVVGSVFAVVPPSTFGYFTICHDAGLPDQTTLILTLEDVATHLAHGDPQVRCANPIPPSAFDPDIDLSNGYYVDEIEDDLYWITDGTYQMMFLVYNNGVIVVDAPPSIGANILNAIVEVTDKPITHVIYSHTHADHIGAAGIYPENATVIAHEDTASQLEEALSPDRDFPYGVFVGGGPVPLPDITFKKQFTLRRGSQVLELDYKGSNHEPGNIFIYAPKQKVLMLVDVIFPAWTPFSDLALAEDIPGFYEAHEQALSYDFETFVGGHLTRLGTREDVVVLQDYILDVRANAAVALQQVDFFAIAQETGFVNQWLLFETYLDAVAQHCTQATLEDWSEQIAGADVFTFSHCWTAMESLRIE